MSTFTYLIYEIISEALNRHYSTVYVTSKIDYDRQLIHYWYSGDLTGGFTSLDRSIKNRDDYHIRTLSNLFKNELFYVNGKYIYVEYVKHIGSSFGDNKIEIILR